MMFIENGTPALQEPVVPTRRDESAYYAGGPVPDDSLSYAADLVPIQLAASAATWTSIVSTSGIQDGARASETQSRLSSPVAEDARLDQVPMDPAKRENTTRLALLARSFASGGLDPEGEARLEIVQTRVAALIPRVTVEDFELLAHHANVLNDIDRRIAERAAARKLRRRR